MHNVKFEKLSPEEKLQAKARFFDAHENDGRKYLVSKCNKVISRSLRRNKEMKSIALLDVVTLNNENNVNLWRVIGVMSGIVEVIPIKEEYGRKPIRVKEDNVKIFATHTGLPVKVYNQRIQNFRVDGKWQPVISLDVTVADRISNSIHILQKTGEPLNFTVERGFFR